METLNARSMYVQLNLRTWPFGIRSSMPNGGSSRMLGLANLSQILIRLCCKPFFDIFLSAVHVGFAQAFWRKSSDSEKAQLS